MAIARANGIEIDYEIRGEGEPLLLIMGLGLQQTDWPPSLLEGLVARGFQVITFDNRDIGLSTEVDAPVPTKGQLLKSATLRRPLEVTYTVDDMAADTAGMLDAVGLSTVHVVGLSMGGMIAQSLAINHAERVASLTSIMSTTGDRRVGRPTAKVMSQLVRRPEPTRETALDLAVEAMASIGGPHFDRDEYRRIASISIARSFRPGGTARQMAAVLASGDRTPGLRRLDVPGLVVHGIVDPLIRPSGGIATAAAIPGARLLMFNDMGHDLPRDRMDELADAIASNAARRPVERTASESLAV